MGWGVKIKRKPTVFSRQRVWRLCFNTQHKLFCFFECVIAPNGKALDTWDGLKEWIPVE